MEPIVGLRYSLRRKSVGFYQVGTGAEIAAMDIEDDIGTRKIQYIVISFQLYFVVREACPPKVSLRELILLNHGSHSSVEYENFLLGKLSDGFAHAFATH